MTKATLLPNQIDGPLAVIGDLHGRDDLLENLLARMEAEDKLYSERWLVFVGDFLDRGRQDGKRNGKPLQRQTMDRVCDLRTKHKVTACMGNHDLAILGAMELIPWAEQANWKRRYVDHYSSRPTFQSYGVSLRDGEPVEELVDKLRTKMPAEHQQFLASLPWCVEHPDYLIVHAGLTEKPYLGQIQELRARDFAKSDRPAWLCEKSIVRTSPPPDCPFVVISGHDTIAPAQIFQYERRILLDTCNGHGATLTAVLLPERKVITN